MILNILLSQTHFFTNLSCSSGADLNFVDEGPPPEVNENTNVLLAAKNFIPENIFP